MHGTERLKHLKILKSALQQQPVERAAVGRCCHQDNEVLTNSGVHAQEAAVKKKPAKAPKAKAEPKPKAEPKKRKAAPKKARCAASPVCC